MIEYGRMAKICMFKVCSFFLMSGPISPPPRISDLFYVLKNSDGILKILPINKLAVKISVIVWELFLARNRKF